jgi:hypothetical protein
VWGIPDSWYDAPVYPSSINSFLIPVSLVIFLVWGVMIVWKLKSQKINMDTRFMHLLFLLGGFILIYFMIIFGVYLTTYPPITIANRMLSPMYTAILWFLVMLVILTANLWQNKVQVRWVLTAALILFAVYYGWRSVKIVKDYYADGLGYLAPVWQQSQTMDAVRRLPENTLIVTNETTAIQFLAGRPAYPVKEFFADKPVTPFTRYGDGDLSDDEYQKLFHDGKAVLVLFDTVDDQISGLYGDQTNERISSFVKGLYQSYRGSDGGLFYYLRPQ